MAYQMNFALLFFTLSAHLTVTTSSPFQAEGDSSKKYGDACEALEYCHGELVSCQQGKCACFAPEDMVYDEFLQGCVVQAGKKCVINTDIWKASVNCIDGAFCDDTGTCVCAEGFFLGYNGTCTKKRGYRESCSSDKECDNTGVKSFVCVDGQCDCDKRGNIYDEDRGTCVSVVDSECEMEDEDFECTTNAVCRQNRCSCKHGFAKSVSQECKLGFGKECNPGNGLNCADIYFMCINGKCACKHPIHQVFDERTQECLSLVSGPCTFPRQDIKKNVTGIYDIQKCIKNAMCVDKGYYSECQCKSGYVETKSGTCAPGLGESCGLDECDPISPLYCRNGTCQCQDLLQYYDPTIKKCVGLVGSRCTRDKPNCVEFASCVISESETAGQCICDKYSVEVANRTCVYKV